MLARQPFRDFRDHEIDGDGGDHHVSINGNPVFDGAGRFVGYRGTGREVTAEVEAAQELALAKERAEAASRAKSEFLANMSHELRTPLNAVIGFSELIHDQPFGKIGANYVEYASEINSAGHHLLDMINDVLDLSKIEAGRYELAEETVELGMVVRSCIGMLKPRSDEGGVQIENRVNGVRVAVRGDGRALKQIVLNLLSNAVKFTPRGGVVSLHVEFTAEAMALVVTDTGIGIDAAALRSLGQPFQQADASIGRRFGGTGLGLAISRKLLGLHGGTLTIESVPGRRDHGASHAAARSCHRSVADRSNAYPRACAICLTRAISARRAAAASAARASSAGNCAGRATIEASRRQIAMAPCASSAATAAAGRLRSAGSQTARSTANGTPCSAATRATAPLSRSVAAAAVRPCSRRLSSRFATIAPAPSTACVLAPPSRRASSWVGRMTQPVDKDDRRWHHQGAWTESRVKPASQAEAHQRIAAAVDQPSRRRLRARRGPAADRHPPSQAPRDTCFRGQSDDHADAAVRSQTPPCAYCRDAGCGSASAPSSGKYQR